MLCTSSKNLGIPAYIKLDTYRFAYLVNEIGILPSHILCVTFTNKAAAEMRRRIRELTGAAYFAGDVNKDSNVNIKDATAIQYFIARIKNSKSHCGETDIYTGGGTVSPTTPVTPTTPTEPATTPAADTNKVYFRNTNNWSPVRAYFWSDSNQQMMSWPGNEMQSEGGNVYSATIPDGATMVIFTKGDDSGKTADLDLQAGKIYDNGWSDYNG